jgi:hypothetical protein
MDDFPLHEVPIGFVERASRREHRARTKRKGGALTTFIHWLHVLGNVLLVSLASAPAALGQNLDPRSLPVFPWAEPRVKVWRSDVDVGFLPKYHWIDNETVVFPGRPLDPKADLQKRKAMPLFIVRWHLPTNRITYGHPVDDQFCYSPDGNVSFILYQRTDGVPDIRRGYFVEDQYFGPIDAPRKLEGAEKEAFKRGFDEATCGPRGADPPPPAWVDQKKYSTRKEAGGWILSSIGALDVPKFCSDESRSLEHCALLPFGKGARPITQYLAHLPGFALMDHWGGIGEAYVATVQRGELLQAWRVLPNKRSGSPRNAVFTRVGLIELLPSPPLRGLIQVRGASRVAILRAHIKTGYYLQDTVSADGCKVVFASAITPDDRMHVATVTSLCGD